MKKIISVVFFTAIVALSVHADDYTGKVTKVITKGTNQTDAGVRGRIYFKVSTALDKWPNISPTDVAKKEFLTVLLTAMSTGANVRVSTTGSSEYAEVAEIEIVGP